MWLRTWCSSTKLAHLQDPNNASILPKPFNLKVQCTQTKLSTNLPILTRANPQQLLTFKDFSNKVSIQAVRFKEVFSNNLPLKQVCHQPVNQVFHQMVNRESTYWSTRNSTKWISAASKCSPRFSPRFSPRSSRASHLWFSAATKFSTRFSAKWF